MEPGYYWVKRKNQEPEIAEFCGALGLEGRDLWYLTGSRMQFCSESFEKIGERIQLTDTSLESKEK